MVSAVVSGPPGFAAAKQDAVRELGEEGLLLPGLLNRGLKANDGAKYLMSLFQMARDHADGPEGPAATLRDERLYAGVEEEWLDQVVAGSRRLPAGEYAIPEAERIHALLAGCIEEMLAPLDVARAMGRIETGADRSRLHDLLPGSEELHGDRVQGAYLDRMGSADRERGDSLHLLVMEAHRGLNRLQALLATESLDGAAVYGLAPGDEPLVRAFMAGVRSTAPLKLDHPGLGSTATRADHRLLIQNDIGTTNAHILVVSVEGLAATVTCTDVHLERLRFFQDLLRESSVQWSDTLERRGGPTLGPYHLVTGRYEAPSPEALEQYLRHLGSRLVFLIDWNRARKRLGRLVGKRDAIALLRWAADEGCGHMAFLAMGGERLIYDAVELAARVPARYGEPLRDLLGPEATLAVLRYALRASAEGVLHGKSQLLIRDELRVEVLKHLHAAYQELLDAAAEHGSLVVEAAQGFQAALASIALPDGQGVVDRTAARSAEWEHRADSILGTVRVAALRVEGGDALVRLVTTGDDAIDALEEATYLLTLIPAGGRTVIHPLLDSLAATTAAATREHLKALEIARELVGQSGPEDVQDFLVAVDRVVTLEHEVDQADRAARAALVTTAPEFRSMYVADRVCQALEEATDALMRSVLQLRDHVLAQMPTGR